MIMKNTFISKYKLISLLGTGGMSKVYLGQNTKTSNKVAIKILNESLSSDPQYIKRFKREVEISRTLSHPNIIKIISCGTDKGRYYIVYEYIEGLTLDKYIKSKKLSIKEIEEVALQILKGLSCAHSKNIIHRDIKPSNIMISNGNVKILDFGIARATTKSTITKTGMFMGSPHYTSPEQINGKKIDYRTDIYSLGIVLYEMVTGKVPFTADTPLGFVRAHLDKPVPKIKRKIPSYFEEMIYKCLEKRPDDRYKSVKEISSIIKSGIENKTIIIKAPKFKEGIEEKKGLSIKKKLVISIGIVTIFLIAVILLFSPDIARYFFSKESDVIVGAEINGVIPDILYIGEVNYFNIKVKNTSDFIWKGRMTGGDEVRFSYHLTNLDNGNKHFGQNHRTTLFQDIKPGEIIDLNMEVVEYSVPPGNYKIEIDPVIEGRFWFSLKGGSLFTGEVEFVQSVLHKPSIELKVINGPEEINGMCSYLVKAMVTGYPQPIIEFNRDDRNGGWGENIAEVNITKDMEEFILEVSATNSEGFVNEEIILENMLIEINESKVAMEETTEVAIEINGDSIVFSSDRDGDFEIYIMDSDGANIVQLTDNNSEDCSPCFSPDGDIITFSSDRDGDFEIYIMDSDGANIVKLTDNGFYNYYSCFSPDGDSIAFSSRRDGDFEIYIMDLDGNNIVQLTDNDSDDWYISFLPDGDTITFLSSRDGSTEKKVIDTDGNNIIQLTDNDSEDYMYCFSPDGDNIAFSSYRDGDWEIYMMDTDGANVIQLTDNDSDDHVARGGWK